MSHKSRHAASCLVACVFVHQLDINSLCVACSKSPQTILRSSPGVHTKGLSGVKVGTVYWSVTGNVSLLNTEGSLITAQVYSSTAVVLSFLQTNHISVRVRLCVLIAAFCSPGFLITEFSHILITAVLCNKIIAQLGTPINLS